MQHTSAFGVRLACLAFCSCIFHPPVSAASERLRSLSQYIHTRWSLADGFTHFPVQALAQTLDGYLWIGTPSGLWRFDGVRFQNWLPGDGAKSLANEDVRSLCASRDGGLWIATNGGIRKLRKGALRPLFIDNNPRLRSIRTMVEDLSGTLWVGVSGYDQHGLATVEGERIQWLAGGGANSAVNTLAADGSGTVWVGSNSGLCPMRSKETVCAGGNSSASVLSLSRTASGRLVAVTARDGIHTVENGRLQPVAPPPGSAPARLALGDRNGDIWVGALSQGLFLYSEQRWEQFTNRDGLSGATVQALLQDREGNVWVGTRTGLDRFRPSLVGRVFTSDGLSDNLVTALVASSAGHVWVATPSTGLHRIHQNLSIEKQPLAAAAGAAITSLFELPGGHILLGSSRGLLAVGQTKVSEIRTADGERLDRVTVITADRAGRIWLSDARRGLYSLQDGVATRFSHASLPRQTDVYAIAFDNENAMWIAFYHGEVGRIRGGALELFDSRHGLAPGPVLTLFCDSQGAVYVGGTAGLSRFFDNKWTAWTVTTGLPAAPIHDMMEDTSGGLWLSSPEGAIRIELASISPTAAAPLQFTVYGRSSGMPPQTQTLWAKPRIARTNDGRLWFATEDGVAVIDPARRKTTLPSPAVLIEEAVIDNEHSYSDAPPSHLSFLGRELRLNYTATSMGAPESLRFRYRLTPFETRWVDAESRRQAAYTNLPPGEYRFEVVASDNEGEWQEAAAGLHLTVLPKFHQTIAFKLSVGLLAFVTCYFLYRWRMTQFARKLEGVAEGRLAERSRIARELHDTLLQSVVGVSLQIDAFANRLPPEMDAMSGELRRIRRQFDTALRDARHSVWALRLPRTEGRHLLDCLGETVSMLDYRNRFTVSTITEGDRYELPIETEEHVLRIAQAAIANAVLHSEGSRITLETLYSSECLIVRVSDDGQGIDPHIVDNGRPGHYGLKGMRERAALIGGTVRIISSPASGTTVELTIVRRPSFLSRLLSVVRPPVERNVRP